MPFDFSAINAPFRMQPGLRRLASGAAQLTPNRIGDRALREKLAVLRSDAAGALLAAPGFDAEPALAALLDHATQECPEAIERHDTVDEAHRERLISGQDPAGQEEIACVGRPNRADQTPCVVESEG